MAVYKKRISNLILFPEIDFHEINEMISFQNKPIQTGNIKFEFCLFCIRPTTNTKCVKPAEK